MLLSHEGEPTRTGGPSARRTVEQVLALAPDEASRAAGRALASGRRWPEAGRAEPGVLWGLSPGPDGRPYRTAVDTTGPAYRCGCPSRASPCAHALGLLLLWATGDAALRTGEAAPDWVRGWLEGRSAVRARPDGATAAGPGATGPADPSAARRRADRRAERITGGARELEQRLADLLRGGLAAADRPDHGLWEETAARMVDAQAPGLAARVRALGAITASGPGWPVRLLEECALLHLLGSAWLRRDHLPAPLAATVRGRVGLTVPAEGPPLRDRWLVLAQYDTPDGKLVTRRVWLYGQESGRTTLLLSFGAAGRAPAQSLPVGAVIDAEVTPYPGGGRMRGDLGERFEAPEAGASPPPGGTAAEAVAAYGRALHDDPWLDAWPVTLRDVIPAPSGDGWQLVAADGSALPVTPSALSRAGIWKLVALAGGRPVSVFGECGHQGFDPMAAWSPRVRSSGGLDAHTPKAHVQAPRGADTQDADTAGADPTSADAHTIVALV
ncbi:SWIM zinc finger family protein [Streptomyces sp. NBC_01754]|uniref:SWIM zinc finger family protein n=1 Tax=Streptomyces sp. NBC_01754 TaxID=2975930 RepID=UPI002DDBF5EE|nr:SWIM zinc finger family protein [Streptomyces sp. NBC_01754]WSC94399.1 SWIM zinc finger family protein [Streptomyces sp. NBC_01754]